MTYIIIAFIVWITFIACALVYSIQRLTEKLTEELEYITRAIANITVNIQDLNRQIVSQKFKNKEKEGGIHDET